MPRSLEESEINLSDVYSFEAWEVYDNKIQLTLRVPEGESTFTKTEKEALAICRELFRLNPTWKNGGYRYIATLPE